MRVTTVAVATLLTAVSANAAKPNEILPRGDSGAHVISINFSKERKVHRNGKSYKRLDKRGTVLATLDNEYLLYYIDVEIGTPPQQMRLQIDTGSSDVWVPSSRSRYCSEDPSPCMDGSYDPSMSTSRRVVERNGFSIGYLDNTYAAGDYVTEVVTVGNITIDDLQIGVGLDTDIDAGILGIGFPANVATQNLYPNIIDELVSHGFINSRAYSLYLNDQESNTGSILFGGIDTEKFEGELIGLPIQLQKNEEVHRDFLVALSSVGFISNTGEETQIAPNINIGVILDCGSSLTYLPVDVVRPIVKRYGGVWSSELDAYAVPCSLSENRDEFVTYRFGGPNGPLIRVAIEELTNYLIDINGDLYLNDDGNPECVFGLQPQPSDHGDVYIFGDTFLRSAYVVHDLDGSKIWMAQTIFNATASNILEIQNSTLTKSGVPDASGVESSLVVQPTNTETAIPRVGAPTGYNQQPNSTETSAGGETTDTGKPNAAVKSGVGSILMSVVLLLAVFGVAM